MGYDISVKFPNQEERDKMLGFLNKHLDLIDIMKTKATIYQVDIVGGEHLGSYIPKVKRSLLIGAHGIGIPLYAWDLCIWMASKNGDRKKEIPYIYYDSEKIFILQETPTTRIEHVLADGNGLHIHSSDNFMSSLKELFSKEQKTNLEVLQKLNSHWVKFCEDYSATIKENKKPKNN